MKVRINIFSVFPLFLCFAVKAQNIKEKVIVKEIEINQKVTVKPELAKDHSLTDLNTAKQGLNLPPENPSYVEGQIPTPEQQGFTKQTVNSKDVYFKEQGQIIQIYTPK